MYTNWKTFEKSYFQRANSHVTENGPYFDIETLAARRDKLCVNFVVKLYKGEQRRQFLNIADNDKRVTRNSKLVVESSSRTSRCYNAPHNALARLVNDNADLV